MDFQVGQQVTADHPFFGQVTGTVLLTWPSSWFPGRAVIEIDVAGTEMIVFHDRCSTFPEVSMTAAAKTTPTTEAPAKRKPGRPKKAQPETENAPVDFKALAAETREKLRGGKKLLADIAEIQAAPAPALPPVGSRVVVSPHDEEGPVGEPFASVVRTHLSPEEQAASDIEGAVLAVLGSDGGSEEHVRVDGVALLEQDSQQTVPAEMPSEDQLKKLTATMHGQTAIPAWPGALGLIEVPLAQTTRSSCNVRSHYDPAAIEELAASLAAQGQQQNATGRWNAEGQIEIVAGESRRRAQLLRVERGEITDGFPFLVRISDMTDGEALAISATENMRRRSMTPLEECEAMQRLQDTGRTVEDLAALFGYKSLQPVADRILVARNLLTTARERLDEGKISLAQAFVIARAPGKDLQDTLTQEAGYGRSASTLAATLTSGQFLTKLAGFNVEKSGLDVVRDLFDTYEPYFKDKAAALQAQVAHANAVKERREKKGGQAFVHVVTGDRDQFPSYSSPTYERQYGSGPSGTVLYVSTGTGRLSEETGLALKGAAKVKADGSAAEKVERKMPESAYLEAHQLRGKAAREAALGNPHLTLALTVWGLVLGNTGDLGRVAVGQVTGMGVPDLIPEPLKASRLALKARLLPVTPTEKTESVYLGSNSSGVAPDHVKLLDLLLGMDDAELLDHLNTLVSPIVYNWSLYSSSNPPAAEYTHIAQLTDAATILARDFILTDEWLKRYPRGDLVKLAEEAGLGRALVEDCKTLKDMRGRILEHAEKLHAEGFVPALVRFPEVQA